MMKKSTTRKTNVSMTAVLSEWFFSVTDSLIGWLVFLGFLGVFLGFCTGDLVVPAIVCGAIAGLALVVSLFFAYYEAKDDARRYIVRQAELEQAYTAFELMLSDFVPENASDARQVKADLAATARRAAAAVADIDTDARRNASDLFSLTYELETGLESMRKQMVAYS